MGYWENRQAQIMYEQMEDAEKVSKELADIYAKASRELNYKIEQIFEKYATRHHLSNAEAKRLLNTLHTKGDITEMMEALKADPKNADLIAELESGAYRARIQRLEQLQGEIDKMMSDVYNQEKKVSTSHYIDLAQDAYYREIYEAQRRAGFQFSFSAVDPNAVNMVLGSNWSGANYSARIWGNTTALAGDLKQQILLNLLTGKSTEEAAMEIAKQYATGAFEARRLVRTESNFISGQMQREAYEDCDAEEYDFIAVLDLRTSDICRELDGKVFKVSEMQPGVNCNPMHPFCRSTTAIHLDDDVLAGLKRRARDPVSGENKLIPASTNYQKWYEQNVANNPKAQAAEKMIKNMGSDLKQWERYKELIGSKAGKSIEAFQELKYNDPSGWEKVSTRYKDTKLQNRIKTDAYNKLIHQGKQGKHIIGHNNYMAGKSYLTITPEEVQEIVNEYAGTGKILRDNSGKWTNKEKIVLKKNIGQYISFDGVENEPTNAFIIHYAKDGVHIVPARKE